MDQQKILVVDDDKEILFSMSKLLEYDGFHVIQAKNGIEALEQFEKEKPDLIILDIMMPKLDGIAALMKIREVSHIPVIILSAKTQDQDKVYGLTMGADDLFFKGDSVYAYTIVQNLFVNAVKYSMEHTRIFVKTYADNGQIVLEVINVSAEPIDVEADKLKERFVRGDASRSTEGNGLGLAIVDTYTHALGGAFHIGIVGDTFKAEIHFDSYANL